MNYPDSMYPSQFCATSRMLGDTWTGKLGCMESGNHLYFGYVKLNLWWEDLATFYNPSFESELFNQINKIQMGQNISDPGILPLRGCRVKFHNLISMSTLQTECHAVESKIAWKRYNSNAQFPMWHSTYACFLRIEFYNERGVKRTATYLPEVAPEQGNNWNWQSLKLALTLNTSCCLQAGTRFRLWTVSSEKEDSKGLWPQMYGKILELFGTSRRKSPSHILVWRKWNINSKINRYFFLWIIDYLKHCRLRREGEHWQWLPHLEQIHQESIQHSSLLQVLETFFF